ncbi:M1 family metallopeptidase [Candidatus Saccharibacteria bacterium]|nr:M1 family metallopeptidase [Candidatus Saccharibacteria bacterium]
MERFLDFFTPKSYILDLFIDKNQKSLSGTVKISGKTKKSDLIKLHSVGQKIDFVRLDSQEIVNFHLENGVLSFSAPSRSAVTVEVGFHGSIGENMQGAYLSTYEYQGHKERIISTQFESHYARECFPCVDEPAAKATFKLSISVPDEDDIVLSNMEVDSHSAVCRVPDDCVARTKTETKHKSTFYRWQFAKTPQMSTYLLAFVIGRFNFVEGKTKSSVSVRTFAPLGYDPKLLLSPNKTAIKSLEYYDQLFGTPYPLKKLDQVAIPDFEAGAMENWGLVTYRESQLLCDESSSLGVKKSVALTITHELSHQWFGNLVTMKWWNDLWLNESFATIMEYYATDHLFPKFHVWADFFTSDCLAAFYRDAVQGVQAVREDVSSPAEIATLFDPCIVYAKGAHLMLMLIREMGEENFFEGLKAYFKKHAYKNAEASDLWASLEPYTKGFSVRDFMTVWITKPGYPVVTDEAQQRFLLDGSTDSQKYPIPEVRDDMSGHYLINLSGPEFEDALKNFSLLSEEQRLRILIDRMLLAETPIVSSASLLPLVSKFQSERSAPVWEIVDSIISKLIIFIDYDSSEEAKYKAFLYQLVKPALGQLGLAPHPSDSVNDTELRCTLMGIALYSKNTDFLASLDPAFGGSFETWPADLRPFILGAKMWLNEPNFYQVVLEAYRTTTNPELKADLRSALAKPRLKENIDFAFSCLKDSPDLKPQDHLGFLLRLRRWRYTKERALNWLLSNWDYIYQINGEKSIEDYPRYFASTIDRRADADQFLEFFSQKADDPVLARTLRVAKNDIEATLSLIASDKAAVLRAINKL